MFMAAILIPLIYDDIFKWYVYILVAGIIVANLVFVISFAIAYHKNKKYKNITNIKYPLEYCTVIVDIYNSKEFICSDGHKEEWKMRCDNGTKKKWTRSNRNLFPIYTGNVYRTKRSNE